MEKEKIKELIVEHKERFLKRRDLIRRDVQREIDRFLLQREIVLVTGVRRSGKSSLLKLICEDLLAREAIVPADILYLNFDDERFSSFTVEDFAPLYETYIELEDPRGRRFLFLDEIQRIPGWERWLNRLYEFEDVRIFVTGSNASMLAPEVSTTLTGRHRQVVVWPFSFREFLVLKGAQIEGNTSGRLFHNPDAKVKMRRFLTEYLQIGGFPEAARTGDATLLEQYWQDILYRDVIARYGIKNIKEIRELALFLASHAGAPQSYKNLGDLIGVKSANTVKNYLGALSDVYLFQFIHLFDYSLKRQIYNPSKVYCVDAALGEAVSFRFSRNTGHIYENIVFMELQRRGKTVFYWKSRRGREVDFVVQEGLQITEAIQVCVSLADPKTRERELRSLAEAAEELHVERLTVITEDEEGLDKADGCAISIVPLWKWLLEDQA